LGEAASHPSTVTLQTRETRHGGSAKLEAPLNQHALDAQQPGGHR
jgi:hypothetical protein